MKTLEAYLLDAEHNGVVDHQIHMTRGPNGEVRAIVFPIGGASDGQPAVEWEVRGDTVCQPFMTFDAGEMLAVEGPALATQEDVKAILFQIRAASSVTERCLADLRQMTVGGSQSVSR